MTRHYFDKRGIRNTRLKRHNRCDLNDRKCAEGKVGEDFKTFRRTMPPPVGREGTNWRWRCASKRLEVPTNVYFHTLSIAQIASIVSFQSCVAYTAFVEIVTVLSFTTSNLKYQEWSSVQVCRGSPAETLLLHFLFLLKIEDLENSKSFRSEIMKKTRDIISGFECMLPVKKSEIINKHWPVLAACGSMRSNGSRACRSGINHCIVLTPRLNQHQLNAMPSLSCS